MAPFHIILLTEQMYLEQTISLSPTFLSQQLWRTIELTIKKLNYRYETVTLDQLDTQEQETVDKVLNADLVLMVRFSVEKEALDRRTD